MERRGEVLGGHIYNDTLKGCVIDIVHNLMQSVRSGLSYSGARNITQLQAKAEFIVQSSASQIESSTHILRRY